MNYIEVLRFSIEALTLRHYRSSRPEVFCKKGVLRNFTKFTEKHRSQSLFFNKVAELKKYLYDRNFKYYIENKCHRFFNLRLVYIAEYILIHYIKS